MIYKDTLFKQVSKNYIEWGETFTMPEFVHASKWGGKNHVLSSIRTDYIFLKYFQAGWNLVGIKRVWTITATKNSNSHFYWIMKKKKFLQLKPNELLF